MARKKDKNTVPLKHLAALTNEVSYHDFAYKEHFRHLCNLVPNNTSEKLAVQVVDQGYIHKEGLVYVFVIKGKIFKIGHTITTITKRIQSYNCGKIEYRIRGTNSTTNYFVLQSLLKINEVVNVYAFFPDQPQYTLFGKIYQDSFPPSKRAEKEILKAFVQAHRKKPIGCTQT